jgi:hypothetical protein
LPAKRRKRENKEKTVKPYVGNGWMENDQSRPLKAQNGGGLSGSAQQGKQQRGLI